MKLSHKWAAFGGVMLLLAMLVAERDGANPLPVLLLVGLYLLPTIVALSRRDRNIGPIVVVNLLLGWTLIGWAVALAMAVRGLSDTKRHDRGVL
ncbi:superinfection immunity protein [Mycolicibacterium sp.]|uniref:superinfection immunity protein n=1 Tax=Mycolicibacterium sp. TaxID=2320850 RepID=UPI00355F9BF1